ncbi:MAG: hypothetical protein J6A39_09585 [Peptococcaceae bacterium]|nr:hypothetical protein [Peptococcaceae bacterium]
MSSATSNKNMIYYIHIAVYLIITFGVGFLKPFGQITELGMDVLGVFIGVIYGWIFLGLTWPSIFTLFALAVVGYGNISALFSSGISYYVIPITLLGFMFAAAAGKTGLNTWFGEWLMSLKIIVGRPYALILVLLLGMEMLTMMNAGYVGLFMVWGIAVSIAEQAGLPKRNPFICFMIPAILVIFVMSGFILPFLPSSVMYMSFFTQGMGTAIPELPYMIWQLIIVNCYVLVVMAAAKFVFRIDMSAIKVALESYEGKKCPKMDKYQRFGFIVLVAFLASMISSMILPATWPIIAVIKKLGVLGMMCLFMVIFFCYRKEDGTHLVTVNDAANGIGWDVVWLLIATTPLAAAFQAEACGILPTIMGTLTPMLMGMSPAIFIIACSFFIGVGSQFIHNLILIVVFVPLLVPMCAQMGGNPYACYLAIYAAAQAAYMTPAASMTAAFIFGHPSLEPRDGYINGAMHFVLSLLVVYVIGLPAANILFPV